jgi:alcohol dehydrogenase
MKAAILKTIGSPMKIENLPDLELGTGEVIVDVITAPVISYTNEVISGKRTYSLKLPMAIGCGCVGRVRQTGPDATHLRIGDYVFCDPTVRSRDSILSPDIELQGWTAPTEGAKKLQEYFLHGSFAEQIRVPTENAFLIPEFKQSDASYWCAALSLLVPYGGLLAIDLQAGETLAVSGATGSFGSATVAVALAMGAAKVIALGRNINALESLKTKFGSRVATVALSGDAEVDQEAIQHAANGPIDCVLDILPPQADVRTVRTAIMSVRPYGRIVLMGGVGLEGGPDLEIPYRWLMRNGITLKGQWMYSPKAVVQMINLINSGLIDLKHFDVQEFKLDNIMEAVEHAAQNAGPFKLTVVQPS